MRKYENVNLNKLKPYKNNARTHSREQIEKIALSIKEFGFINPVLIDEKYGIIAGHGRVLGAKQLGIEEVPCLFIEDLTEAQKRAYILADNKLALDAGWDDKILKEEIKALDELNFDISIIDFNLSDFDFDQTEIKFAEDDYNTPVNLPTIPKSKYGDIYKLGNHRLMCGDSTKYQDIEKLMNGNKAEMVFTDPPYNMSFNGRSGNFEIIKNDDLNKEDFKKFIDRFINMLENINPKTYYICCNWFFYGILQLRLEPKACIVWAKNNFGLGKGYRHQHEFILFKGFIKENIKNETDLWTINKDVKYMHPTQKPIEISSRAIQNSSEKDDIILDMFGGSGSTLISCEQLNRKCYMMELDPKYVDVIIGRWEKFTGKKAVKIND